MNFNDSISIDDLRTLARRRLPRFVFDYVDGGAEDEVSMRRNRQVFENIAFRPRTLLDVSARTQRRMLLGAATALPVVVGPTGLAGICWAHGDLALARASSAFGVPFTLSAASMDTIESIAEAVGDGRAWFQIYVFRDRSISDALIRRAAKAGYETLVVTSDTPMVGKRERDWHNGLRYPLKLTLAAKLDVLMHPRWLANVAPNRPSFVNVQQELKPGIDAQSYIPSQFDPSVSWQDFQRFREMWPRKLLLKGVLRVDDAVRAAELGADGIVLSNHGGRQLDGAISGLEVLPEVARELKGRVAILVDGGVRRGGDIVKALALGADAVHLGRAPLYGLAVAGATGVTRALKILNEEVDRVQALIGCRDLAQLPCDVIA